MDNLSRQQWTVLVAINIIISFYADATPVHHGNQASTDITKGRQVSSDNMAVISLIPASLGNMAYQFFLPDLIARLNAINAHFKTHAPDETRATCDAAQQQLMERCGARILEDALFPDKPYRVDNISKSAVRTGLKQFCVLFYKFKNCIGPNGYAISKLCIPSNVKLLETLGDYSCGTGRRSLEDVTNLLMTVDDVKMILYFNEMSACIHVWQLDILLPFKYYMIQEAMMSLDPPNFIVTSTMEDVCIGWLHLEQCYLPSYQKQCGEVCQTFVQGLLVQLKHSLNGSLETLGPEYARLALCNTEKRRLRHATPGESHKQHPGISEEFRGYVKADDKIIDSRSAVEVAPSVAVPSHATNKRPSVFDKTLIHIVLLYWKSKQAYYRRYWQEAQTTLAVDEKKYNICSAVVYDDHRIVCVSGVVANVNPPDESNLSTGFDIANWLCHSCSVYYLECWKSTEACQAKFQDATLDMFNLFCQLSDMAYRNVTLQNCITDTPDIENQLHFKQSCGVSLTGLAMQSIKMLMHFSSLDPCDQRRTTELESIEDITVCLLERVVKVLSVHQRNCGDFFQVLGAFMEAFKRQVHSLAILLTSAQKETCCGSTGQAKLHPYCSANAA